MCMSSSLDIATAYRRGLSDIELIVTDIRMANCLRTSSCRYQKQLDKANHIRSLFKLDSYTASNNVLH